MTVASPPGVAQPAQERPGHSWPWALGALLAVALVWGGAYVGHRAVAARHLAAAQVAPPIYPPAPIIAVLRPEAGAPFVAQLDAGHVVLLAGRREITCPPSGACSPSPPLDTLLVVDARTGATDAQAPLVGASARPVALAVDAARALAAVVSAHAVDLYATTTGAHARTLALPAGSAADAASRALVTAEGTLIVTVRTSSQPALVALNPQTGADRFTIVPPGATAISGPVYDPATGFLAVIAASPANTTLARYDPISGAARGAWKLPSGTRLGPLDATSHLLFCFEADGTTATLPETALNVSTPLTAPPPPAQAIPQPALAGARALGWNHILRHVYVASASGLRILDAATGGTLAALPLPVNLPAEQPLLTDETNALLLVPTDHGALASIQDAANPAAAGLTPATAALLARAAVATLPPQNGQKPPFLTPATFTIGPGARTLDFYAYDADFGTAGPYPGSATLAVTPATDQSGAYDVRFTITWTLRFAHSRSWVYRVDGDGSVHLVSQSGDGLPCCQTPGQTSG